MSFAAPDAGSLDMNTCVVSVTGAEHVARPSDGSMVQIYFLAVKCALVEGKSSPGTSSAGAASDRAAAAAQQHWRVAKDARALRVIRHSMGAKFGQHHMPSLGISSPGMSSDPSADDVGRFLSVISRKRFLFKSEQFRSFLTSDVLHSGGNPQAVPQADTEEGVGQPGVGGSVLGAAALGGNGSGAEGGGDGGGNGGNGGVSGGDGSADTQNQAIQVAALLDAWDKREGGKRVRERNKGSGTKGSPSPANSNTTPSGQRREPGGGTAAERGVTTPGSSGSRCSQQRGRRSGGSDGDGDGGGGGGGGSGGGGDGVMDGAAGATESLLANLTGVSMEKGSGGSSGGSGPSTPSRREGLSGSDGAGSAVGGGTVGGSGGRRESPVLKTEQRRRSSATAAQAFGVTLREGRKEAEGGGGGGRREGELAREFLCRLEEAKLWITTVLGRPVFRDNDTSHDVQEAMKVRGREHGGEGGRDKGRGKRDAGRGTVPSTRSCSVVCFPWSFVVLRVWA
jgi:hypothetical protein